MNKKKEQPEFYECKSCKKVCAMNKDNFPYCRRCKEKEKE
jgi:hypothetical protein